MSVDTMRFASSITDEPDPIVAATTAVREIRERLHGASCDVVFLFVSTLYRTAWDTILRHVQRELGDPLVLGCTGGGVLGVNRELEFAPALALEAAHLPRVQLHPFVVQPEELLLPQDPGFWIEKVGANPADEPAGILLPEPMTCDVPALVAALNTAYPKMPLVGGLASSAGDPSESALFLNDQIVSAGAVGVALTGDVILQTIVSQGCRPIGRPYIVTQGEDNVIFELASATAVDVLRQVLLELSPEDQTLAQRALLIGLVMDERKPSFTRGDFLIRNLAGVDQATGALVIGDRVQVGQTIQFQLRDATASRQDLQVLLDEQAGPLRAHPSAGALLFSCLGRGRDLYGEPDYDIRTIRKAIGDCPIAGFFCNGEIGPIAGRNFLHGFTSSLGLFRPRQG